MLAAASYGSVLGAPWFSFQAYNPALNVDVLDILYVAQVPFHVPLSSSLDLS